MTIMLTGKVMQPKQHKCVLRVLQMKLMPHPEVIMATTAKTKYIIESIALADCKSEFSPSIIFITISLEPKRAAKTIIIIPATTPSPTITKNIIKGTFLDLKHNAKIYIRTMTLLRPKNGFI